MLTQTSSSSVGFPLTGSYQEETLSLSAKDTFILSSLSNDETPAVVLIIMAGGQASLSPSVTSLVLASCSCVSSELMMACSPYMVALDYLIVPIEGFVLFRF